MLLRFELANVSSIAEMQELSLVATRLRGGESGLLSVANSPGIKALPAALIYGPNASGKSNFLQGITFMRNAVVSSHRRGDPSGGVPRVPFALDGVSQDRASCFEAEFIVDEVRYVFGFTCDSSKFLTEWLYSFPEGKRRRYYERNGKDVVFGASMPGAKRQLVEFMRDNSLFISTATQNDHESLSKIANFFRNIEFSGSLSVSPFAITRTFKEGEIDPRTIEFLKSTGTGVVGMQQTEKEVSEKSKAFMTEFMALTKKHIGEDVLDEQDLLGKDVEIELLHQGKDKEYALSLEQESAGTMRLLIMLTKVFSAIDQGTVVLIDELDASLHTIVSESIIRLFCDPKTNKNGAQIIATTHDTNILGSDCLRRDQVWFCEKDNVGATHLFSLADFKLRSTDHFERGYLEGRFGAIPFSGDLQKLFQKV